MIIGNILNEITLSAFSLCIDAVMLMFSLGIVNGLSTMCKYIKLSDFEKLSYYAQFSIIGIAHSALTLDRLMAILEIYLFRHLEFMLEHSIVKDDYINTGYLIVSLLFAYGAYKIIKTVLDLSLRYYRAIKVS